jgi:chromosome segregation protein
MGQLKGIGNKATKALHLFGVDARLFTKFIQNLKGAAKPTCIAAVSCFVVLHLFSTVGVCAVGGAVFLVNLAVSRARLEIMKEDLEAARQAEAETKSTNEQLGTQNAQLLELNQRQKATLTEQEETIKGAQKNVTEAQDALSAAQEELSQEQQQSAGQTQLIAQQEAQLKAQETYIAKCQSCLTSVFTSQQTLIQNLEQRLATQTNAVKQILQNVQNIAKGEQKLTEALGWAHGQITAAQTKLTAVIGISTNLTDPAKCKDLIESGQFQQTAQEMQKAAQEAYNLMNELNSGLTSRILDAQSEIAKSRLAAENKLGELTSLQQETSHSLEQANEQIRQKEQEIERLNAEHKAASAQGSEKIQALTVEIAKEKQSLEALTHEKGTLTENLQKVEGQLSELRERVQSLTTSNTTLQIQCQSQEQLIAEQRETIENQRQSIATNQEALNNLQSQMTQGKSVNWLQTAANVAAIAGTLAFRSLIK